MPRRSVRSASASVMYRSAMSIRGATRSSRRNWNGRAGPRSAAGTTLPNGSVSGSVLPASGATAASRTRAGVVRSRFACRPQVPVTSGSVFSFWRVTNSCALPPLQRGTGGARREADQGWRPASRGVQGAGVCPQHECSVNVLILSDENTGSLSCRQDSMESCQPRFLQEVLMEEESESPSRVHLGSRNTSLPDSESIQPYGITGHRKIDDDLLALPYQELCSEGRHHEHVLGERRIIVVHNHSGLSITRVLQFQ